MKIIVIDDEERVRRIVGDYLKNEGYQIIEGSDGYDGIEKIIENKDLDLILLDVRMPKMNGYETLKEIRKITDIPVIFLTALNGSYDEVKGLDLGADDYITKPFTYEVLIARVKSCLRRSKRNTPDIMKINSLEIDFTNYIAKVDGENIRLTQKEFEVVKLLIKNKNITVDRTVILDRVWGYDYYGGSRTVDTHIKTIRAKLGKENSLIKTVRGVGYRIEINED